MLHLPHLITDLGFILVIAALATLLFKKLGQPLVLGYLIAGFLVSPHVPFLPTVTDNESIKVWSEIGVIFLLFSLGLEFSFKKLFKVGGAAGFTAVFEVIFMLALGYGVGRLFGWNNIDSLFFGGILSISSTTIIVRAFHELGLKGQKFVDLVFGILVVEDIVAILLLVLLSTIAGSDTFSAIQLLSSALRLLFYIALWFVVGIFFIPLFLRKIRTLLEDETTLLVATGLCFMMVMIASGVGFSPALGAFIMGSLLAETPEGHKMEHLLRPVKNLFAAVFFVSVGMMIDPQVLIKSWDLVLAVTLVTILGKFISTFLGAILSGQNRRQSFQAGMSLAQIGEFSFIIASLGVSLKVTSDFLYPLAIAVSAVTTFTTPYLIKIADPVSVWADEHLPEWMKRNLDHYHQTLNKEGSRSAARLIIRAYGLKIFLNTVVVVGILGIFQARFAGPWTGAVSFFLCFVFSAPFLWGILMGAPSLVAQRDLSELKDLQRLQYGIFVGRTFLVLLLIAVMIAQFANSHVISAVVIFAVLAGGSLGVPWIQKLYSSIEKNFLKNLTEKEKEGLSSQDLAKRLLPWDANIESFDLSADLSFIGKSLKQLSFKEQYGVTVAAVFRGSQRIVAPDGDFVLWPQDRLICFGSQEELQKFNLLVEEQKNRQAKVLFSNYPFEGDYKLISLMVEDGSELIGKTIHSSGLREKFRGLVVGVERDTERLLGPAGRFELRAQDLLWIVSDQRQSL